MASCESIYRYVNGETDENSLHLIEATVQQDIAFIVDNSLQYISASLDIWRTSYQNEESDYYVIAEMTSRHMCNLMKVFFVTEQFALLEKLMETYKKYLLIECHFEEMRQFMATYV